MTLAPYRTFPDVAQPESTFILRMKGGSEHQAPTAALFEADGGKWALMAVERIAEHLSIELEGWTVLA